MKRKLHLQKNINKYGFTLFELLMALFIFSICIVGSYFIYSKNVNVIIKNEEKINEIVYINNCYDLFISNPNNFENNILNFYEGYWIENTFIIDEFPNVKLILSKKSDYIYIKLFLNEKETETWVRKVM